MWEGDCAAHVDLGGMDFPPFDTPSTTPRDDDDDDVFAALDDLVLTEAPAWPLPPELAPPPAAPARPGTPPNIIVAAIAPPLPPRAPRAADDAFERAAASLRGARPLHLSEAFELLFRARAAREALPLAGVPVRASASPVTFAACGASFFVDRSAPHAGAGAAGAAGAAQPRAVIGVTAGDASEIGVRFRMPTVSVSSPVGAVGDEAEAP